MAYYDPDLKQWVEGDRPGTTGAQAPQPKPAPPQHYDARDAASRDAAMDRYRGMGTSAGAAAAPTMDRAGFDADRANAASARGQQQDALGLARSAALGNQPSAAELAMQRGVAQGMQAQLSAAAGARGGALAGAAAQRGAMETGARMQADAIGQGATLRAQEMERARDQYAQQAGAIRAGDYTGAGQASDFAYRQAGLQEQQNALNAQTQLAYEKMAQGEGQFGAQTDLQQQAFDADQRQKNRERQDKWIDRGLGGVSAILGSVSDVRAKDFSPRMATPGGAPTWLTEAEASRSPKWLDEVMARQLEADEDAKAAVSNLGVTGAPRGYAASRAGQDGYMFGPAPAAGLAPAAAAMPQHEVAFRRGMQALSDERTKFMSSPPHMKDFVGGGGAMTGPLAGGGGLTSALLGAGVGALAAHSQDIDPWTGAAIGGGAGLALSDEKAKRQAYLEGRVDGETDITRQAAAGFGGDKVKAVLTGQMPTVEYRYGSRPRDVAGVQAAGALAPGYHPSVVTPMQDGHVQERTIVERKAAEPASGGPGGAVARLARAAAGAARTAVAGAPAAATGAVPVAAAPASPQPAMIEVDGKLYPVDRMNAPATALSDERTKTRAHDAKMREAQALIDAMRVAQTAPAAVGPKGSRETNWDTPLSPSDEAAFQAWKARWASGDSGEDYDYRGAFRANEGPGSNGHWTDRFKKPNHETFSEESQYSNDAPGLAGYWGENDRYVPTPARIADDLTKGMKASLDRPVAVSAARDRAGVNGMEAYLHATRPSVYQYKPEFQGVPGTQPGPQVGPASAQQMARTPVGATMIEEDPETGLLGINKDKALKTTMSAAAYLNDKIDALEKRLGRKGGR